MIEHPFPHQVLDDAFPAEDVQAAAAAWPAPDWEGWHAVYQSEQQRKRACNRWEAMPAPCRKLLAQMAMLDVSAFGQGLIPDLSLWGGGMHAMHRGDRLGLHLDATHHPHMGLRRRLNAVLFASAWQPGWGGALEFWDAGRSRPVATILPQSGRLVLFAVTDSSWHGVPAPLACPEGAVRASLACWWYGGLATGERPKARFA